MRSARTADGGETYSIRLATADDIFALEALIPRSVRVLQQPFYSPAQIDAALGPVFGVDRQLIADRSYFVAEHREQVVGCGGWSCRRAVFGGDRNRIGEDTLLNPADDPARIRAFFVDPAWTRRGVGRTLLAACESAIRAAGFQAMVLVATLAGEPFYLVAGYAVAERYEVPLGHGLTLPVVRMFKKFPADQRSAAG